MTPDRNDLAVELLDLLVSEVNVAAREDATLDNKGSSCLSFASLITFIICNKFSTYNQFICSYENNTHSNCDK